MPPKKNFKKKPRAKHAVWWIRWVNTTLVTILTPIVFLGFVYLLLFFILNSSVAPGIFHGQLSHFLRGEFTADTLSTDALLRHLTLTNVRLAETGHEEHVITTPKLVAKIPIEELLDLVTKNTFRLGAVVVHEPDVVLDFSKGELNILRVVLPYFSKPDPPDPIPGDFVTYLADMSVINGNVHLIFDGFRIDLTGTDVDHYSLRTSSTLSMNSPKASENNGKRGVRVKSAEIRFNPALFSFALADVGPFDEGLVFSGGSESAGTVGYASAQVARQIEKILRQLPEYSEKLGAEPMMRGDFVVRLKDFQVDNYHWEGDTMYIPAADGIIGNNGSLSLRGAMMNVGPKQEDIDRMQAETGHRPSGLLPEESILWAAKLDLALDVDDPILNYFVGPVLHGDSQFHLRADMRGDLARVSGDVALDIEDFDTFDIDIARLALRAAMDGQHVSIHALEADTLLGGAAANGFYEIMDGNFDIRLWAGTVPEKDKFNYIVPEFQKRLAEGMVPLDFLPDGSIKRFSGTLRTQLHAKSQNGVISLFLPKPLEYKLDEPLFDIKKLVIAPVGSHKKPILTYAGNDIRSPAGLKIDMGTDYVQIAQNLHVNLKNIIRSSGGIAAHIEKPELYASGAGIGGLTADPVDLDVRYNACGNKLCGGAKVKTGGIDYMGIEIPDVDIDLGIEQSDIVTHKFRIATNIADINADIRGKLLPKLLETPKKIPFNATVHVDGVDLASLKFDAIKELGLAGIGGAAIHVNGTADDPRAELNLAFEDIDVMDIPVARLAIKAKYENEQILLPKLGIWFDNAENQENDIKNGRKKMRYRKPDFSINSLTCDLKKNTVIFNTFLQPISPNRFKIFRDLGLPVEVEAGFDLAAKIDLNWLLNSGKSKRARRKSYEASWLEGSLELNGLTYADLKLGNTLIEFSRSSQYALIRGNIIDMLELSGFVRTAPGFSASIALNFPNLDILGTLDRIGIDIRDIVKNFNIQKANVSGSIGFCMKNLDDMQVSILLDDLDASILGNTLSITQPAHIRADIDKMALTLRQFEFKYRDTVLKLNGDADIDGNVSLDVNGEIDAALARSFAVPILKSSGLLAINLTANGNILKNGHISFNDMDIAGYLGVRDPIQVLTDIASSPIEMSKGFLLIDNKHPNCGKREICAYTPQDQPFTIGINGQWVELSLFAGSNGKMDASLGGTVNTAVAQLFVKDISNARGAVELDTHVAGRFIDRDGSFNLDLKKLDIGGHVAVIEPIMIEMRSMPDPIIVNGGILKITEGNECIKRGQCVVIPSDNAFRGSIMGGDFIILGEIARDVVIPKNGFLSVTANNINFRMKDELTVTASPDIQITAKDFADFETVRVSGNIDIAEAKYKRNFDDGSSNFIKEQILSLFVDSRRRVATYSPSFLRKMPDLGKIKFDVGISAENSINVDVRIAGATVELELGTQAKIGGTIVDIAPTGIFSINSGLFSMNDNDFDFQSGSQIAFNGSLDGKIDITASAEISTDSNAFGAVTGNTDLDRRKRISSSSSNASGDLYSITLTVGGSLFQPNWSFESSPYLSDANVYALILTGKTIDDFSGNDIAMESLLSPLFSSQLDSFIDADQFKFLFSEGAAQFVYVKQITKALRIAAGVSIRGSDGNEQALSGEYYFNDNWYVDLTGQNTSDEEGRAPTFKLGARLHWHLAFD